MLDPGAMGSQEWSLNIYVCTCTGSDSAGPRVPQANLLFLLARGLLYDKAADDELLQVLP